MKKYRDIERLKPEIAKNFCPGDMIHVSEKIDGANVSIRYNAETDSIDCFSRKNKLDAINNLRGAWQFAQTLNKEVIRSVLSERYILFGEWNIKHTIPYPKEAQNKMYFYDIWDCEKERYLKQDKVKEIVESLGLNYVPVFYEGEFISWEECMKYVGRTELGGEIGEGIVVKLQPAHDYYTDREQTYTKIVTEKMKEHREKKTLSLEKLAQQENNHTLVRTIVTEARIRKMLNKFVDEGIIPEDWDEKNMKDIAKNLGRRIYEDCTKEEPDVVIEVGADFGKIAAKESMEIARKILEERLKVV